MLISDQRLLQFAKAIFKATGSNDPEAQAVAEHLVRANLSGVDSHGVIRIAEYIDRVEKGMIVPNAQPKLVKETVAIASLDARFGYGQIAGAMAMELATKKARECGTGSVTVFNCNHTGRIAEYSQMASAKGMVGVFMVKSFGSIVAPWGGRGRILSTNPITFAIPSERERPIVADFATSVSSEGKIRVMYTRGEKIPPGWVVDKDGRHSQDPADLYEGGAIQTFGEFKGYAINLLLEALGGALTGGGILDEFVGFNGVFAQAVNVESFVDAEEFRGRIDKMVSKIRSSPLAEGFSQILLPGDPEYLETQKRKEKGIFVEDKTWNDIVSVAKKYAVEPPAI